MKKDSQGNVPKKRKKKFMIIVGDALKSMLGLEISVPKADVVLKNIENETKLQKDKTIIRDDKCEPSYGFQKDKTRKHFRKKKRAKLGKQ